MYNRYIRNDSGQYQRVSVPDRPPEAPPAEESPLGGPPPPKEPPPYGPPPPPQGPPPGVPPPRGEGKKGFLSGILSKFKLEDIDTGDLLLLLILFLLFKDGEDEELLIALGLLLIL